MSAKMRDLMALTFFLDSEKKSNTPAKQGMDRFKKIMEQPTPKQKGIPRDISKPKLRE